ncbi:hypothetical protein AUH73_06330 [archaeon 13_1_40CM_4_53_4]|nr:MAG: hypothetical protein AUH73_06330 [archaeon 13_1_40CM_4_53_4]OLE59046.1 MAG: hypothetical protein AUG17_04740 [Crenarchaeota archaeon 13_1_20CM_2_53_14]
MNPTRDFSEALLAFHASCSLETILRILEWPSTAGRFAVRIKRTEIAQRGGEEVDCCLVQCSGRVIALRGQTSGQEGVKPLEDAASKMTVIPIVLCLLCGIFSGTFTVALLFRRIAIALAIAGPVVFSALWIWWDWDAFRNKHMALGAFAVGFSLTFLALDREP